MEIRLIGHRLPVYIGLLALLYSSYCYGQEDNSGAMFSYQKIDVGQGIQLDYLYQFNQNWWLTAGLYVHFNTLPTDDQGHAYHNRGWGNKWHEHLGVGVSVNRSLINYGSSKIFVFYNTHVLHIRYRMKAYIPVSNVNGDITYRLFEGYISDPILTWENTVGLGLKTKISDHIGINIRGGLGLSLFYDPDIYSIGTHAYKILGTNDFGGMTMLSAGVYYSF